MKRLFLLAALVSGVAGDCSVFAQKADSTKVDELNEVVVKAIRADRKTPVAYTNLTKEQLKGLNYGVDVPYLLSLTPSITTTSDAGNGIGYTSFRVRGTDPSRINITANGIPLNDAESSTVFWVNMGDFASSVQSMQIQRGVGTSTNGSGAFGATLNMLTESIGSKPYLGIDASGGSYGSHKETLRFSTGMLGGHWGLQGRLSDIGSQGYLDRASTKLNSYFLQGGWYGEKAVVKFITWNGIEETYHAWNYTSKYEQSLYGRTYNSCGVMEYDVNGNPSRYYEDQTDNYHQQNYQLIWNQQITDRLVEDLADQQKMDNDFYGFVASLNYNNRKNLDVVVGGGWNQYSGDQFGRIVWTKPGVVTTVPEPAALLPDFEYYRNHSRKTDFNFYGKATYDFLPGLNAFVDLQYRHVGYRLQDPTVVYGVNRDKRYVIDNQYNFFNPKFGINYDINSQHKVYASYGIGHKEPVRNNFMQQIANPDREDTKARPERLNDLEVGYKYQSKRFTAGANIYWMDYKDQLVLTGELNAIGEALTKNLESSYRLGLELEAAWMPVDWFRWDANATFSRNRVKDMTVTLNDGTNVNLGDQPLAFSPNFILNNIFTFSYKGMKASVHSQYISDQYLTNTGFKDMECKDENGNTTFETLQLKNHFCTNVDLSYNFSLKKYAVKDITAGVTLYNIFSAKFDNNGWAAPQLVSDNGTVKAVNEWGVRDSGAVGFAPSAPFNVMAHVSVNF